MGVLGLWQLLAPVGQPVTLESLENKVFAVDISIWLNQALKGYRDSQGGSVANAHLLSLFSRLCKLLFYKIRPIIVFDGGYPELKKQTIIIRQQRRAAVKQNSKEVGLKVLANYLASQQLGQSGEIPSTSKVTFKHKEKARDEIFKLSPLPENSESFLSDSCEAKEDIESKFTNFSREDIKYLNKIDIESEDFDALPAHVKQEILSTLKESRKHRSWDQYDELPKESNDFSSYQLQCLLKKRKLQSKLEQVQKDLRNINSSAYVSQYTNDHVIGETNKIMSDDTSYYVLLKKIVDKKESYSDKNSLDIKPSVSIMADTKNAFIRDIENIDDDDDDSNDDIKIAMMNSLHDVVKKENNFLDLSDEEYMDNPPLVDAVKRKSNSPNLSDKTNNVYNTSFKNAAKKQRHSLNLSEEEFVDDHHLENVKEKQCVESICLEIEQPTNVDKNKDLVTCTIIDQEALIAHARKQLSPLTDVIICNTDNICIQCEDNKSESEIVIIKGNLDTKNMLNEPVVVSSDDEMIPCEDEDTGVLFESISNDDIDKVEKTINKSENTIFSESIFFNEESESNVMNKHLEEKSSVTDKQAENISFEKPSTSSNLNFDSSKISNKNLHEVNLELQRDLETAAAILEAEQAKQDRQANTVQDHMIEECKELLQLFGIPYIVSPLEAEAQCAFYDKVDLTHGTITDDSDVWLFGGKRVFKNFFTQQKFVECYKDKDIFSHFGLSRIKLINFALLTGSDYTEGIEGVGPVTAMEIISEFPGEGIDVLQKFKDWWDDSNKHTKTPENKVRAKFKKLILSHNFPDEKVFDAYLNPEVDSSTEKFTWGRPDLDGIREYTKERFGWNQSKVDAALLPVLKKLNERDRQTHIDSFFSVTLRKETNLFPSKRIMSALKKITSPQKEETRCKTEESKPVKCKVKTSAKKIVPKKINKNISSARGRKRNIKSKGPILSESSSDSD